MISKGLLTTSQSSVLVRSAFNVNPVPGAVWVKVENVTNPTTAATSTGEPASVPVDVIRICYTKSRSRFALTSFALKVTAGVIATPVPVGEVVFWT